MFEIRFRDFVGSQMDAGGWRKNQRIKNMLTVMALLQQKPEEGMLCMMQVAVRPASVSRRTCALVAD